MRNTIFFSLLFVFLIVGSSVLYILKTKPPTPTFPTDTLPELPIRFYSWKEPVLAYTLVPLITKKVPVISQSKRYSASVVNGIIRIHEVDKNKVVYSIPLSAETVDSQLVWISEKLLIAVEKVQTEQKIDNFYIIDIENGEKQFFTGSFPVPSRLNLDKEIKTYEEGHVLIMEDNEKKLWQLDLMFD